MLGTKRVEIAGKTYVLTQLTTAEGLKTLAKITKILGPAFGAAFKTLPKDAEISMASLGAHGVGELISQLSQLATPDDLTDLANIFVDRTEVVMEKNQIPLKGVYSIHFAGDFGALFSLLAEHLNFNFASFFKGLGITAPQR